MERSTEPKRKSCVSNMTCRTCSLPDSRFSSFESHHPTMHGDRAIIGSVFATNRNAILDFHNLANSPETFREATAKDHGHEDGSALSSEIPPVPDVLPAAPETVLGPPQTTARGSFSRRGMRLGVHMSILDMGAHSAPDALKDKWIQTSRSHHPIKPMMSGARSPDEADVQFPLEANLSKANLSPEKPPPGIPNHGPKASHGWISSPTAGKLHKMIDHLELSHSAAISKLIPHFRRRSSVSKHPTQATHTDDLRRRRSLAE